ncbi:hypothetical protein FULANO1_67 [Escherichia phage vB_EcoD_Fulano1]|uniref:Uncharacterized protein n=1 Tax=Escherichia phage vB_EcoD_Fulano1 TaxID=2902670 RepID=A0AC61TSX6_9CAUD|nr:hypothetical protein FULANO1_67 [Escherichia phage vB_EcoD_Fulano1]
MEQEFINRAAFCDTLRDIGRAIGSGERETVFMPEIYLRSRVEGGDAITASYMRQVVNRVPEVKQKGVISIKRKVTDEGDGFVFTLTEAKSKPRVLTGDDIAKLEIKWRAKFIAQLLKTQPRISDLEGERLEGAAIALERMNEMLNEMVKVGDE